MNIGVVSSAAILLVQQTSTCATELSWVRSGQFITKKVKIFKHFYRSLSQPRDWTWDLLYAKHVPYHPCSATVPNPVSTCIHLQFDYPGDTIKNIKYPATELLWALPICFVILLRGGKQVWNDAFAQVTLIIWCLVRGIPHCACSVLLCEWQESPCTHRVLQSPTASSSVDLLLISSKKLQGLFLCSCLLCGCLLVVRLWSTRL